ncbi:MAG: hypothetical protein ACJAWV_003902 [Flammeovirgaceae bacterium]|jgi:hypothetical protein
MPNRILVNVAQASKKIGFIGNYFAFESRNKQRAFTILLFVEGFGVSI